MQAIDWLALNARAAPAVLRVGMHKGWTLRGALRAARLMPVARDPLELLAISAANVPDQLAVISPHGRCTYRELEGRANRLAWAMHQAGLGAGDVIVNATGNRPEFFAVGLGVAKLRGRMVPASPKMTARELRFLADDSRARLVYGPRALVDTLDGGRTLRVAVDELDAFAHGMPERPYAARRPSRPVLAEGPGDNPLMLYTSGTTGRPKGALLDPQAAPYAALLSLLDALDVRKGDVLYTACPLYHAAPIFFASATLGLGNTLVTEDHFDPAASVALMHDAGVTAAFMVPTQINKLVHSDAATLALARKTLRVLWSGGAPLPAPQKLRAIDALGDRVGDFYGATEYGIVSVQRPQDARAHPTSVGTPVLGASLRVYDEGGRELPRGEPGELYARTPLMSGGYHGAVAGPAGRDGHVSVGDVARIDHAGRLYIVDRKKDLVISGGVNVSPAEVEARLLEHAAVYDAAVIGIPDERFGEAVMAFVVLRAGHTAGTEELIGFCREALSPAKCPKRIDVLAELPRSAQGKVLKKELREPFWRGTGRAV